MLMPGSRVQLSYSGTFGSIVREIARGLYDVRFDTGAEMPCTSDALKAAGEPKRLGENVVPFVRRALIQEDKRA